MDVTKRLLSIRGALDPQGASVTFTLESEGGEVQTFSASSEVFDSVLAFMLDLDAQTRKGGGGSGRSERIADPLHTAEALEIFLDMRAGRALLRVHATRGRTVQLELSEELLVRLEGKLPKVLAELRKHGRGQPH
jgi:hypothetical protein